MVATAARPNIATSVLTDREAIYAGSAGGQRSIESEHTRERPGAGVASVLTIMESSSGKVPERPAVEMWNLEPGRTERDHTPRLPPIACNLRFIRVGRSRF
jgi:hypothetical protein